MTRNILTLEIEKTDRKVIRVDVSVEDTISSVLSNLRNNFGVPSKYSLVFHYKELDPSRTLKSYLIGSQRGNRLRLQIFERRDELKQIERNVQSLWRDSKIFEQDAPPANDKNKPPKFFATFPFPYVNGLLHCGHGFSLSKAEFACGFQRLLGKKVLFPFGFHCTGMPIVASANRLSQEIAEYGDPPNFPKPLEKCEKTEKTDSSARKKKGKLAGKKSRHIFQFDIMRELGIPEGEIAEFADPHKWVRYFTPKCLEHLQRLGCKIDTRRSFVTTDLNPFFSRFVEWQFSVLKEKGVVRFGKRMCVFSPRENQPCADHDRASGEGVQPQEYTAMKLQLLTPGSEALSRVTRGFRKKTRVFLIAGTLRPETMYGQTNCFVKPNAEYVLIPTIFRNEVFVCSQQSARNMSYQGITPKRGDSDVYARVKGWDLLGSAVSAPNSAHEKVYVLPLPGISMAKATAIVTSVPSDSPEDYVNYCYLRENEDYRKKYRISPQMVQAKILPIISIPGYSGIAAADAIKKYKVKSPNDEKNLRLAKEEVYLKGFYKGNLAVGEHKGAKVEEAKEKIKQKLIDSGQAFRYFEPSEPVTSRSGEACVVAETSQWFLHYGEEPYKSQVLQYVEENMEFFSKPTRDRFRETVLWMRQWACSRKFGLGTKLPFSEEWLIESLSDSTIYMAYYTIAHFLSSNFEVGESDVRLKIQPQDLSDGVLDAIFRRKAIPKNLGAKLTPANITRMRAEFEYWYPMDLRVSGKDLLHNHLVMCLYNHAFLWAREKWPRAMFANGHATIDAEKMSKSTGNFLTLAECVEQYGADATRLGFADAGDGLDDANFAPETCNAAIIRLTKERNWIMRTFDAINGRKAEGMVELRRGGLKTFADDIFENEIRQAAISAKSAYASMKFRVALNRGFYSLCSSKKNYVAMCGEEGMHAEIAEKYIRTAILVVAPICSHWSEHLWKYIGNEGLLFSEGRWPEREPVDSVLYRQSQFLKDCGHCVKTCLKETRRRLAKKKFDRDAKLWCNVFVTDSHPPRRLEIIRMVAAILKEEAGNFENASGYGGKVVARLKEGLQKSNRAGKDVKEALNFASFLMTQIEERGANALEEKTSFDQKEFLRRHWKLALLEVSKEIAGLRVRDLAEIEALEEPVRTDLKRSKSLQAATPGRIGVYFSVDELQFE